MRWSSWTSDCSGCRAPLFWQTCQTGIIARLHRTTAVCPANMCGCSRITVNLLGEVDFSEGAFFLNRLPEVGPVCKSWLNLWLMYVLIHCPHNYSNKSV